MLRVGRKEHEYFKLAALSFVQMRVGGNASADKVLRSRADAHPVHPPAAPPDQRHIRAFGETFQPCLDDLAFTAELTQPERKDPLFPAAGGDPSAHGLRPQ